MDIEFHQALDLVRAAMICLEAIPAPFQNVNVDELVMEAYDALEAATRTLEPLVDEAANFEAESANDDIGTDAA